jgi:large subunit ribosomal protein L25
MEEIVLKAESREVTGKQVRALRRAGLLPAVLYGHHIHPIAISLDHREASHILPRVSSSQLIQVEVGGERYPALVREKQRHPVTSSLLHVDFQAVSMPEKLRAMVRIELTGDAPAVKNYNGVLVTGQEEIEVECLPGDLINRIVVDLSKLTEIGNAIHVSDLPIPATLHVLTDADELVVLVTAPAAEEKFEAAEAAAAEPVAAEPEVVERGKKEEEEF